MIFLKWLPLAILSILGTIVSYFITPIACLFLTPEGDLRYLKGYLQTTDNLAIGDGFWTRDNPTYSRYKLAVTWLWRNPAQGLDQKLMANVTMQTPVKVVYETGDNYLYTCDGYFHFSYRIGLMTGGMGWRLNNIVKGYEHKTMGQIVSTILRFHK